MIRRSPNALAFASALVLSIPLATACGSKGPTGFVAGADDGGAADGGDDGSGGGSSSGGGTSSGLSLGDGSGSSGAGLGTGTCKDGTYSGTFQCSFQFNSDGGAAGAAADAGGLMITGTISFQLMQQTGTGETFMDTASGSFSGTAATFFAISATVGGTLNCNTGVFTGTLSNGMYSGFLFLNGTFSGPLTSDYNGTTFSFVNGMWNLTVPGQGSCPGTWTANYTEQ